MNSLKTTSSTPSQSKNEQSDVKTSSDRKAIWAVLSQDEKDFFEELNNKFNTTLISGSIYETDL